MPLTFEEDPETPGLIYATDTDTGMRRPAWDPDGSLRASIESRVEPVAPPPAYVPEPPSPVTVQEAMRAEGPPAPPAPALQLPRSPIEPDQSPMPAPLPRSSGAPPAPPPAPAGTVLSKAKLEQGQPGYAYDKGAEEQRGADLLDRTLEQDRRAQVVDAVLNEQQLELQKQRADAEKREAINAEKSARYDRELKETVAKEINPDRIQENTPLLGSILGIAGRVLGMASLPGSGVYRWQEQVQKDLDNRITRDIESQKELKESSINLLTKQLGNAQQAENHYRAQVNATAATIIETRLKRLGIADAYADQIQGLRDQAMAYNEAAKAASFGKPGKAEYQFELPKPVAGVGAGKAQPTDATATALRGMNISLDDYLKGLDAKTEFGTTVSQIGNTVKQIDADALAIKSLMASNGGELQGTEIIQLPESLVPWAAQMGLENGMTREQVNQILMANVEARARQIFGSNPPAGFQTMMQKEMGASTAALLRWMQRMRDQGNNAARSQLGAHFRGNAQRVYDLYLGDVGGTHGIPQPSPEPFETRNAPDQNEGIIAGVGRTMKRNRKAIIDWFKDEEPIAVQGGRTLEGVTGLAEQRWEREQLEKEGEKQAKRRQLERFLR